MNNTSSTSRAPPHSPPSPSPSSSTASSRRTSFHSTTTSASTVQDQPVLQPQPNMPVRLPSQPSSVQIYDALEKEQEAIVNRLQRELSLLREEQQHQHQTRARSPIPPVPGSPQHRRTDSSSSSVSRRASSRSTGYGLASAASAVSDSEDAAQTPNAGTSHMAHSASVSSSSSMQPPSAQPLSSSSRRSSRRSFGSTSGLSSAEDLYLTGLRKENESLKKRVADMMRALSDKDCEIDHLKKELEKFRIENESAITD
ncbi:uncharacterized protein V1513DRAFT_457199 [Lipomyces chichibuensis]|uniref:uncharacterized protein n=1 Tax=Lipomyces chichibuensis TaxID=1546026 RepID=UPI003343ABDD